MQACQAGKKGGPAPVIRQRDREGDSQPGRHAGRLDKTNIGKIFYGARWGMMTCVPSALYLQGLGEMLVEVIEKTPAEQNCLLACLKPWLAP